MYVSENLFTSSPEETAMNCLCLHFCGVQVGSLFDAYNVRFLAIPGCIGIVACVMLLSVCKGRNFAPNYPIEFYQLLTFGVLGGKSASLLFNASIVSIDHWFSTGLDCTAGGFGGVVSPPIILYMAPELGFLWAIRNVGLIKGGGAVNLKPSMEVQFSLTILAVLLVEFAMFIPYTYICAYAIHQVPHSSTNGEEAPTTAFAAPFGFWSDAAMIPMSACVGQGCKREDCGRRSGTSFFVSDFAALLGVPFAGAIIQWQCGAYHGLIPFAGRLWILSFCTFAVARGISDGWRLKVMV
ncbi:hypothetical protein LY78DRAFT_747876 [Colletotrichum sublineola]|nr:hypothetical protein LY78DRAFT_747876 [Colletotrichum sublineola]